MSWVPILLVALAAFAFTAFVLKLPRSSWTMFATVLVLGLAGYAWQGSTLQPGSPKAAQAQAPRSGDAMVDARLSLFDDSALKTPYITTADAFARRGQFGRAASLLRRGLVENPQHLEGWMALGMALVEHADGAVTPAARNAFDRASEAQPGHPGPALFLGTAYFAARDVREARAVWGGLLDETPPDAPWRSDLQQRVDALDRMLAGPSAQAPVGPSNSEPVQDSSTR